MNNTNLVHQIDQLLPQTQCTRCGYPSCVEYAQAIAENRAEINQCPPGGEEGIRELAKLLNKSPIALNPEHGTIDERKIAFILEDKCIGCTLCIKACPVDAIVGANKMMHTVITTDCSGCDLCAPACPVDCIEMHPDPEPWTEVRKWHARSRYDASAKRKEDERKAREQRLIEQAQLLKKVAPESNSDTSKNDFIAQIMARAQNKN
ncbi:MAG: RnfABCDGE type electron transport complex subunit B [Proteobacteria bacterium]|nr:MAG: RnfABCDGE type electron transport complex subunit B [Pseudomonadota bacterium]